MFSMRAISNFRFFLACRFSPSFCLTNASQEGYDFAVIFISLSALLGMLLNLILRYAEVYFMGNNQETGINLWIDFFGYTFLRVCVADWQGEFLQGLCWGKLHLTKCLLFCFPFDRFACLFVKLLKYMVPLCNLDKTHLSF
ncbi:uncharacterized protein LOC143853452 isoform X3 [Tasmannia lanceolata]|uniref:uncharacterized protein LOC143853452 isoform X3 n=1 Tax=Tasmannia lanceolata TaxID=3420 RepID=UPI004063FAFB